jgi:hypothetical protein
MENISSPAAPCQRLRAIIEIDGGEPRIYPIGNSDADTAQILDALRFTIDEQQRA